MIIIRKKTLVLSILTTCLIVSLISIILPYYSYDDYEMGLVSGAEFFSMLIIGYIGYFLVFLSIPFLMKFKFLSSKFLGGIGEGLVGFNFVGAFIGLRNDLGRLFPGFYIGFISWIGMLTGTIILIMSKEFRIETVNWHEISVYIKKLPSIYNELEIREILTNLKLKRKNYFKLKALLEDLIYNKEIEAKIMGEMVVFTSSSQQNPIHQPTPSNVVSQTQQYYQAKKSNSKYSLIGIFFILIGIVLVMVGVTGFFVYIPLFSEFYIGEIFGVIFISLGVGFIRRN